MHKAKQAKQVWFNVGPTWIVLFSIQRHVYAGFILNGEMTRIDVFNSSILCCNVNWSEMSVKDSLSIGHVCKTWTNYPNKRETLNQCWVDVWPASTTLAQHRPSIGSGTVLLLSCTSWKHAWLRSR